MNESFNRILRLFYLTRHHAHVFFGKTRALLPVVLWALVLCLCFDVNYPPANAAQGYLSAAPWFFFVTVLFGYLFLSGIDMTCEYILILQINSRFLYSVSKILFLAVFAAVMGAAGCIFPVIIEWVFKIRGSGFIPGGIGLSDVSGAFILNSAVGCLGASLAYLFQPNPYKTRRDSMLLLLCMFSLMAVCKEQIFNPAQSYFLFVFTPMIEIIRLFNAKDAFAPGDLLTGAVYGGVYCVICAFIGYLWYDKRVYGPIIAKRSKNSRARERAR